MSKNYLRQKVRDFFIKRKLAKVKKVLDGNGYPPTFNPQKWKRGRIGCNCYAYVLDAPVKDNLKQIWLPGVFSGKCDDGEIYSSNTLIENIKADLEILGFSYRKNEEHLKEGEYRIAIYYIPSFHDMPIGFHCVRQDKDGKWSEKKSWNSKVEVVKGRSIVPPDLSKHQVRLCKTLIIKKSK